MNDLRHTQSPANSDALFTVVHPGSVPFLEDFVDSLSAQDCDSFDIWIATDEVCVKKYLPGSLLSRTRVYPKCNGVGHLALRVDCLLEISQLYQSVICVDSDDILESTRVASAVKSLESLDCVACGMRLIDKQGHGYPIVLDFPDPFDLDACILGGNVFGLSNSAYRCSTLGSILPEVRPLRALDWQLSTLAWLKGARLGVDPRPLMRYRQYESNIARVLPPFDADYLELACDLVVEHLSGVLNSVSVAESGLRERFREALGRVNQFRLFSARGGDSLREYIERLNAFAVCWPWWSCVAHPELEELWNT